MVDLVPVGCVDFADGKRWAGYFIVAAGTAGQATHKRGLAAAQVTNQLNNLTAP